MPETKVTSCPAARAGDTEPALAVQRLDIKLERDIFLRSLIRELAGTLEDIVGYDEAAGYISLVGQNIGEWINALYKEALGVTSLSRQQVAQVLVDLKRRIEGCFSVVREDDASIVLTNSSCPFAEKVLNRPSMCMMTSNVFGTIAANNLGYAKVVLKETIAGGDERCTVIVYLQRTDEAVAAVGREYYGK
ncbi:hypothetical protein GURASL_28060 [Geotalea uraniireducens]|uniref:Metanogen output domain-containing protein n=1 Tax=Geotalea uraniireducens TaxID=351604 RepID=A0ABM8ENT6_9BACT|nr:methanogen output domain 1-containing protein [Geotalea uraniireducens]BDV43883.1 hypothetical protein GURASL_28060 [Geotalea uraniireducens]